MIAGVVIQLCLSTQFGHPGDGYGGRTPTVYHKRPVEKNDVGIAHRTWPIGAMVRITNIRTGKSAKVRVIDRGPYGKIGPNGRWFNSRRKGKAVKREGKYRGCADLTPKLVRMLGHNKRELVMVELLGAAAVAVSEQARISEDG